MKKRIVTITGAYGYLGSLFRERMETAGWATNALVRSPRAGDSAWRWSLGEEPPRKALDGVDALIHCAYDFGPRKPSEVSRVNVGGSRTLLDAGKRLGVGRMLVVSSMSAYEGTRQVYGSTKLDVEALTLAAGGVAIRPGLVYGKNPQGMAGSLRALGRMPVVPTLSDTARQFPVHEDDLSEAVLRLLESPMWTPEVIGVAQSSSVTFSELMRFLVAQDGRRRRFVRVPWQAIYLALRTAEMLKLPTPLRADSVIGLVRPAPCVPRGSALPELPDLIRSIADGQRS